MKTIHNAIGVGALALGASAIFGWALGAGLGSRSEVSANADSTNGIIALTAGSTRLFLIDTEKQVILVYDKRNNFQCTLVAARHYAKDAKLGTLYEIQDNQRGMTVRQVAVQVADHPSNRQRPQ